MCCFWYEKCPPPPILLDGINLPWNDRYKHLGHLFCNDGSLNLDVDLKKDHLLANFMNYVKN